MGYYGMICFLPVYGWIFLKVATKQQKWLQEYGTYWPQATAKLQCLSRIYDNRAVFFFENVFAAI